MTESPIASDLSPEQCRAARALLDWSQEDLANKAGITRKPLADFEAGKTTPYARTRADLRAVLEAAGVEFVPDGLYAGAGGAGVRARLPEVDGWTISLAGRWMRTTDPVAARVALVPTEDGGYSLSSVVPEGEDNLSKARSLAMGESAQKALRKLMRRTASGR